MKPKLTLCMIVKNESHIILECLNSIYNILDYWVICDTGSTDGTQDIIKKFFEENNNKYTVGAVTVEHNYNVEKRDSIYSLMVANDYKRVLTEFSRWDDFFVRNV